MQKEQLTDQWAIKLQGFFDAFEWINNKTNQRYLFTINLLPNTSSLDEAVRKHFGDYLINYDLQLLDNWQSEISKVIGKWLFSFLNPDEHLHLEDPQNTFYLSHESFRSDVVTGIMKDMHNFLAPKSVCKFVPQMKRSYYLGNVTDEFIIEGDHRYAYLHFSHVD